MCKSGAIPFMEFFNWANRAGKWHTFPISSFTESDCGSAFPAKLPEGLGSAFTRVPAKGVNSINGIG